MEVWLNHDKFQSICDISNRKSEEILVEIEVPSYINIGNHKEVIIKWLNQASNETVKMLQEANLLMG